MIYFLIFFIVLLLLALWHCHRRLKAAELQNNWLFYALIFEKVNQRTDCDEHTKTCLMLDTQRNFVPDESHLPLIENLVNQLNADITAEVLRLAKHKENQ